MPASAPAAQSPGSPATTPQIRFLQLAELERVAAKYGFPPMPNELPHEPEPEPSGTVLRRHLAHLRLEGSVLCPFHRPRPRLGEIVALDGVPLLVEVLDRYPPLEHCILCGGSKGETYTICAGCYTTQARFAERMLLEILPDAGEDALAGIKPLTHEQFVRAVRRTPRLEPKRRGRPHPEIEAVRRAARRAAGAADWSARLAELRDLAAEEGLRPADRRRRTAHLRAAEAAAERVTRLDALRVWAAEAELPPEVRRHRMEQVRTLEDAKTWDGAAWRRALAASPVEDAWLALLAEGHTGEEEREADDEYPVEWREADWLAAPDRVDFLEEIAPPLIPRPNTAAGGPEHLAALERNALFDAFSAARRAAVFEEGRTPYLDWLARELEERGGIPARTRARTPQEWDAEACERWDRWVDHLLGGDPAPVPEGLDPFDAARCAGWGEAATTGDTGARVSIQLCRLDSGLPSGRLRWPRFIREEIEAELQPWGRWVELPDAKGGDFRVWTDADTPPRRRRMRPAAMTDILRRRLETWAKQGSRPRGTVRPRALAVARPRGSVGAWEREIRADRRRRRFEQLAHANGGVHPTHLEQARSQSI